VAEVISFIDGCMWEGGPWEIRLNCECSEYGGSDKPCKHCGPKWIETRIRPDGSTYKEVIWICPRVVVARNEGGCNDTGVCLDCILEAATTLPKT
jgi:hypothetical protein